MRCQASLDDHADAIAEVGRLLAACPFLLKAGLRDGEAQLPRLSGGAHDVVRALLGEENLALTEWVLHGSATRTAHKAKAVLGIAPFRRALLRLRQLLARLPLDLGRASSEHSSAVAIATFSSMAEQLEGMSKVGGACFRLLTSPIPPTYQRHVTRALLVWLAALPLALPVDLGVWPILVAMVTTSYLTLGIDEIAIQHEQSFAVLPLHELAQATARGVATALSARPPPLPLSLHEYAPAID
ncbi:MAG: hypothetical protein SGPRY_004484, partial [Prymnesium sp.]